MHPPVIHFRGVHHVSVRNFGEVLPESEPSNHGDIPKPIKGPVTNDLGLSLVKQ